jgi:adenylate cyclase
VLALSAEAGNIPAVTKRQRRTNLIGISIGLVATAVVVAAYAGGALERLELITLDLRFRHTNSIPQSPDIVCIDIDDTSLEVVGRWPWSRDVQAALIAIPAELGARAVLVDLTWSEAEAVRTLTPPDADILFNPLQLTPDDVDYGYPDYELRVAIAGAVNVYLACDYAERDIASAAEFHAAVDALLHDNEIEARRWLGVLRERRARPGPPSQDAASEAQLVLARIVVELDRRPSLNESELATRLGLPLDDFFEQWFERCRKAAAQRRVRRWLDARPERWEADPWSAFPQAYEEISGHPFRGDTPLRRALASAFRFVLSYEATMRNPLVGPETIEPAAVRIEGITPVYYAHARAARRCGFVNFQPDSDGVVRRVPLLGQHGDHVLAQVAFALACDELGLTPTDFRATDNALTLQPRKTGRSLKLQLDERRRTIIPWTKGRRWERQFEHIPAEAVWSLFDHRGALQHNRALILEALATILKDERFASLAEHRRTIADVFKLQADIREARYRGLNEEVHILEGYLVELQPEIEKIERVVRERAAELDQGPASSEAPSDASSGGQPESVETLLGMIDACHRAMPELEQKISTLADRLRAIVQGKICLIGYTATSLADTKPIPTSENAPGVMTHANLLNGLLTGRMVHWASTASNGVVAVAFGVLVSFLSTFMRPRLAAWLVLFMLAAYLALAGAVAFFKYTYWIALTPAGAAMIVPFFAIAVYRYVFIDAERRQLATALGQYTSKEIARQVAENPELCRRAEMREVTAMFTDLKGFTPISERIGAERTQKVLNACLGGFTEVMLRQEAMVNKFIGDGVFAFWNPVIYPQTDHAMRACHTAVDLIDVLRRLSEEQRRGDGDPVFGELVVRVGIATGNAIVGPCGSEQKYDYTCIGDSVNVASRLESANKFYGTQILVNSGTREQVGGAFEFRPLGGVRVKGKEHAVPIYELLGRAGQVAGDTLDYARAFGEAVALFQQRQWQGALDSFRTCHQRRPDDLAAEKYIEATAVLLAGPPDEDWTGAIELKEK